MTLLLVAFTSFVAVEAVKLVMGRPLPAGAKLALSVVASTISAWILIGETEAVGVYALAGSGLAALIHKVHRWFSAAGDGHLLAASAMVTRRAR